MKIGIITHYDVHNHGAVLQLYALENVLKRLKCEVEALTFTKKYDFLEKGMEKKYNISLSSIPYYLGYLKEKGGKRTLFNVKKKSLLDNFKRDENIIGRKVEEATDLDAIFIGSDEVFSIETGLTEEFWGGNIKCNNIFSYAGCFGPTTLKFIEEKDAVEFIKNGIDRLDKISVRDMNSCNIIQALSNKDVTLVCDPVLLYGYEKEMKKFTRPLKEKYLVIYAYDNNMNDEKEVSKIKEYARKNNLKIVSAGFYHTWCDENINVSPTELIRYIKFAECVVTDTFHGSVISIISNTEFIVKLRGNNNKLGFLLEEYELIDRISEDFKDIEDIAMKLVDYNKVNKLLKEKREISMNYIKMCLESVKSHEDK